MPTAKEYIKAIKEAHGLVSIAARRLGVSRASVYTAVKSHKSVAQALEDSRERVTDYAESKLYQRIKEQDTTAIIFYLKTQGKARGYIEKWQLDLTRVPDLSSMTDEELDALAARLGLQNSS